MWFKEYTHKRREKLLSRLVSLYLDLCLALGSMMRMLSEYVSREVCTLSSAQKHPAALPV